MHRAAARLWHLPCGGITTALTTAPTPTPGKHGKGPRSQQQAVDSVQPKQGHTASMATSCCAQCRTFIACLAQPKCLSLSFSASSKLHNSSRSEASPMQHSHMHQGDIRQTFQACVKASCGVANTQQQQLATQQQHQQIAHQAGNYQRQTTPGRHRVSNTAPRFATMPAKHSIIHQTCQTSNTPSSTTRDTTRAKQLQADDMLKPYSGTQIRQTKNFQCCSYSTWL